MMFLLCPKVMGELTRDEIKAEMGRSLPKLELTDNLVDLVFTITSGLFITDDVIIVTSFGYFFTKGCNLRGM